MSRTKLALLLAGLVLTVVSARAQISFVNHAEGQNATSTLQTSISTGTLSTTANNLIVCGVRQAGDTNPPSSVTDTIGNAYTHVVASDSSQSTNDLLSIWWAVSSATNATNVVTANWAGGHSFQSILCRQYSGAATASPADASANAATSVTSTSITSSAFSTAQASEVIVACASGFNTNQGFAAGLIGGVTATNLFGDAASGSEMTACEDLIVSSTQTSITASMSYGSSSHAEISALTFKAAGAAAPCPQTRLMMGVGC